MGLQFGSIRDALANGTSLADLVVAYFTALYDPSLVFFYDITLVRNVYHATSFETLPWSAGVLTCVQVCMMQVLSACVDGSTISSGCGE